MFYLFTNLEFGVEFRRVLSGLVRHKLLQATIILSGKTRHRPSSDLRSRWDGVRRAIFIARHDRQLARLWGLPVRTVENINSDRFLARIAASDHGFVAGFNQIFHDQAIQRLLRWSIVILRCCRFTVVRVPRFGAFTTASARPAIRFIALAERSTRGRSFGKK
jgi:hypothetical protein